MLGKARKRGEEYAAHEGITRENGRIDRWRRGITREKHDNRRTVKIIYEVLKTEDESEHRGVMKEADTKKGKV